MCDISKPTKFKTKTVYKVCEEVNGHYYSVFAGYPIQKGKVQRMSKALMVEILHMTQASPYMFTYYDKSEVLVREQGGNYHMINRVSGFGSLKNAKILLNKLLYGRNANLIILKMVIADGILEGSSDGIVGGLDISSKTYAGKKIISFEPI